MIMATKGTLRRTGDQRLRRQAEERVKACERPGEAPLTQPETRRLIHELEVHQIELEMQNEELRAARVEIDAGLARYMELFDFAPIGCVTLRSESWTIQQSNHAAARLLGETRARLVGRSFQDFIALQDRSGFNAFLEQALHSETRQTREVKLRRRGQPSLHVRLSVAMMAHGNTMSPLIAFEDITEAKAREERLAATEQALRAAQLRKDEFLSTLSHELRNPLAPIRNSLQVIERTRPGSPESQRALAVIDRQVNHLTSLVDDLLDVTRTIRGKIQLHCEHIELGDLVRRTLEDHRASFEMSGLVLESDIAPGERYVNADPVRLIQVMINVLSNAEKFTPRGGRVSVTLRDAGSKVRLEIRDTGIGIASDVIEHLFEPFAQAPQALDRGRGGLGLGLAIVKELVVLHGGEVEVSSDGANRGTLVGIELPLVDAPMQVAKMLTKATNEHRRVLIIEDNADTADTFRDLLTMLGHEAEVAYSGPAGIAKACVFRPDIVICDIGLPGMDGFEVARTFRAEATLRDVYLVALSGYASSADVRDALAAGFDQHCAKPLSPEALEYLLGRPRSRVVGPTSVQS